MKFFTERGYLKKKNRIFVDMKILSFILAVLLSVTVHAQNPVQKYVDQLKGTEELKEAVWGIKAMKLKGEVVVDYNGGMRMIPASNMKLLTTGIALNELGADYRFSTKLACSGEICDGVLNGDLYIVGGGDPTIGDRDSIAVALQTTFSQWEKIIRDAGITRIEGRIIGDGRYFDGEHQNYSWMLEDCAAGDGTVLTGLSFGGGLQSFTVSPGAKAGDPVKVEAVFPETPWMTWDHSCTTGAAGTSDQLYYSCSDLSPAASMTGTLAVDVRPKRITCANCYGAMTCAYYFYRYLENQGITASDGPADIDPKDMVRDFVNEDLMKAAAVQDSLRYLGQTLSPALKDIARHTNNVSNNYYAESFLKVLAKEKNGSASLKSCQETATASLKKLGVSGVDRMQIFDGCGLSRKNYVSPDFFVRFLTAMHSSKEYSAFLNSLPKPGKGTLATRMTNAPESTRARVYMKSGSMNGVRCYSGYILPTSGNDEDIIVFSFMTNNTVVAVSRMNFIIDKTVSLLAAEN